MKAPFALIAVLPLASIAIFPACGSSTAPPSGTIAMASSSTSSTSSSGSGSSSSGAADCTYGSDGGVEPAYPATTTTTGCPSETPPEQEACTVGQACTWTTGPESVTYDCQSVTDCVGTSNTWVAGTMKGDGCGDAACCVTCDKAKPGDPCATLGFQCAYTDNSVFPPLDGIVCYQHAWMGIPICEN